MTSSSAKVSSTCTVSEQCHSRLQRSLYGVVVALSVVVSVVSLRYLLGVGLIPPPIVANRFARPFLYIHVAAASTALLLGPIQFIASLRHRYLFAHRITGRIYVLSCLTGATTGIALSIGTTAGPVVTAGFGLLGVLWLSINVRAWWLAVQGRIAQHKSWMIRSFALTFSAVTARLLIFTLPLMGVPFNNAYMLASWLGWVPNLFLAQVYLHRMPAAEVESVDLACESATVSYIELDEQNSAEAKGSRPISPE
jgi:hypothetical protein